MNTKVKLTYGDYFTNLPSDVLSDSELVLGRYEVKDNNKSTYSPCPGKYPAWYNVLTFGRTNRCTQIAVQVYKGQAVPQNTIFMRTQHDNVASDWSTLLAAKTKTVSGTTNAGAGLAVGLRGNKVRILSCESVSGTNRYAVCVNTGISDPEIYALLFDNKGNPMPNTAVSFEIVYCDR